MASDFGPPRHLLSVVAVAALFVQGVSAAPVTGRVEVRTTAGIGPATSVVYAEPLDRPAPTRTTISRLVQKDKAFVTPVLAVSVGSTIEFPNQDPIFHNVFSLSPPAPFDLGLYRAGASQKRVFARAGTYRVFCNIHPQMTASIFVVPTPYVTTAGADGRYTLDLPPGRYRVTAHSDRSTPVTIEVTVAAGAAAVPDLVLDESKYVPLPHKNKFGREYAATAYDDGR